MFNSAPCQSKLANRLAALILLCAGLASCGGGSSDTKQNGNVSKPAITKTDGDYRTRPAPGMFLIAGDGGGPGWADGTGSAARFNQPTGIAVGISGEIFIADAQNHVLRKLGQDGKVSTIAGKAGQAGNADGVAADARFTSLSALASDGAGNLYVSDLHALRKISPQGYVTTLAGMQNAGGDADGSIAAARFNRPLGIAADAAGTVYVADSGNHTIRKVTAEGLVTTVAGSAGSPGLTDGSASQAKFNNPTGIALDADGNLYVADRGNRVIRKISPAGAVSTVMADASVIGHSFGTGGAMALDAPHSIAIGSDGTLYVTDAGYADAENSCAGYGSVRAISPSGSMMTFAGTTKACGSEDGTGAHARFNFPTGIAMTASGELFVSDTHNHTIRKISASGFVSTVAGRPRQYGHADGTGIDAQFAAPTAITVDVLGKLYVTDVGNTGNMDSSLIRRISPDKRVVTLGGKLGAGYADGNLDIAQFDRSDGLAFDASGNLYVADAGNAVVRKISPTGLVTTLAGLAGQPGSLDGTGSAARFHYPAAIAADSLNNLYVADIHRGADGAYSAAIRKISPDGLVTTLAGRIGEGGTADGIGALARFMHPAGIAVDHENTIYVSDSMAHTVRRISSDGMVTTIAGMAGSSGNADGTGIHARFNHPAGLAVNALGNLYIADSANHALRMLGRDNKVVTVAAYGTIQGTASEEPQASLYRPTGIAYLGPKLLAVTSGGSILGLKLP